MENIKMVAVTIKCDTTELDKAIRKANVLKEILKECGVIEEPKVMDKNGRTKNLRYECIECNEQEIVKSGYYRQDERSCKSCGGHLIVKGMCTDR